jgi:type VI secretion system protein ImpK
MRLTDCFMEMVAYIAYFVKIAPARQQPFDRVKADVDRLLSESRNRAEQAGFGPEDYDLARFAIIAWVDETMMNSAWNEKENWQKELLQRKYYQTADAGELFFERLNRVGPHQRDVREIYYLCLAMGFTGRYCHEGDEYLLDQLKTSNLKLLTGSSVGIPSLEKDDLFPDAYPRESEAATTAKPTGRFSTFTLVWFGVPVVLFLGLFIIYSFILNSYTESLSR